MATAPAPVKRTRERDRLRQEVVVGLLVAVAYRLVPVESDHARAGGQVRYAESEGTIVRHRRRGVRAGHPGQLALRVPANREAMGLPWQDPRTRQTT